MVIGLSAGPAKDWFRSAGFLCRLLYASLLSTLNCPAHPNAGLFLFSSGQLPFNPNRTPRTRCEQAVAVPSNSQGEIMTAKQRKALVSMIVAGIAELEERDGKIYPKGRKI